MQRDAFVMVKCQAVEGAFRDRGSSLRAQLTSSPTLDSGLLIPVETFLVLGIRVKLGSFFPLPLLGIQSEPGSLTGSGN